jgi:hypothetical protein
VRPAVLVIGVDPERVPGADAVAPAVVAGRQRAEELRVELVECLVALDEGAPPAIGRALASRRWACVVIGSGLRADPPLLELAVEAARRLAPNAPIAFDTSPADSTDAALRAIALLGEIDDLLSAF